MPHCDPETLALRALGERAGSVDDDAHLRVCSLCQDELESLQRVAVVGRSVRRDEAIAEPPPQVWRRIADDLDLDPAVRPDSVGPRAVPGTTSSPAGPGNAAVSTPSERSVRGRPRLGLVAAALGTAAGILLGVAGTLLVTGEDEPAQTVVSQATLAPVNDRSATGVARVVQDSQGRRLAVEVTGLAPTSGFYEVWLLDAQSKRLVSVGLLEGGSSTFPLPADLDLGDYPLVDISSEPPDGNPAHSSDSVVRGRLEA